MSTATEQQVKKTKSHAFGKDVYLLGRDADGEWIWLEAAQWDCGWYWGFGYVETYQDPHGKRPEKARDISSHSHWDGLVGKHGQDYYHHLGDISGFESVLTERESWELADLMKSFYRLRAVAEIYHMGNSHLTASVAVDLKNEAACKRINEVDLPKIFARVYQILTS